MLEFFPQEKITKEVRASFNLLVSAFVSLAEEIIREEEQEDVETVENQEIFESIPLGMSIQKHI